MKRLLINFFLLLPLSLLAQIDDSKMYQAYLRQEMTFWGKTLNEAYKVEEPSLAFVEKMANYEYGYIAACLDEKKKEEARQIMDKMGEHVDFMEKNGSNPALVALYRSALCAYEYKISSWPSLSMAFKSIEFVEKATELAPENPIVLSLKGNVDFYRPGIAGGSKKRALFNFEKAVQQFEKQQLTIDNWNYVATILSMAQAYDKIGERQKAILTCEKILEMAPNHIFVRDVFFPSLKNSEK